MYISQRAVIKNKKQMKNLLTLFAIILSLGVTNAQTKKPVAKKTDTPTKAETTVVMKGPTKEETIEYIKNEIGENVKNLTATSILFGNLFKAEYIKEISISDCTLTIKTIIESSNEQKRKVENEIVTIPLNKIQNIEVVNDKQESGQIKKNIFNKKTLKNFLRVFCCMIFEKLFSVKIFVCISSYFFAFFRFFFISFSLRLTFFDRF